MRATVPFVDLADLRVELAIAEGAARAAGEIILGHYQADHVAVETKADDSPVTQADRDANAAILELLGRAFPADAVISEEAPDTTARLSARRVWIVDPLDGTRDFVRGTHEFAVHVGLAIDGVAVVGVVFLPVPGVLYVASAGHGAWRVVGDPRTRAGDTRTRLHVTTTSELSALRLGISRHHLSDRLAAFLDAAHVAARVPMGASTKHMATAAGALDAVVNLSSGEFEWDTCAPEVIVREAGGRYTDARGVPFRYNQPDLGHHHGSIASNGACHAALVTALGAYVR